MAADPLYDALGAAPTSPPRRGRGRWFAWALVGLVVVAGVVVLRHRQPRDETVAVAPIETAPKIEPPPSPVVAASAPPATPASGPIVQPNGDSVEYQHGVKIIRLGSGNMPNAVTVPTVGATPIRLQPAPDPRLVEPSRFGPLPRIGPNGLRPSDVYARPVAMPASDKAGAPRIALLVAGFGADRAATAQAAARLPPAVSLGLSPFGSDLAAQAAEARAAGHEILLDLPIGPAPAGLDGAQVLAPGASPTETLDRLRWSLGRFAGYVGVDGSTASMVLRDAGVARPALQDAAARGLVFVGDAPSGAAPSAASAIAGEVGLQSAPDAMAIDASSGSETLSASLSRLEAVARAKGQVVGVVRGGAAAIEGIAAFADALDRRGIVLVPVSALAGTVPGAAVETRP